MCYLGPHTVTNKAPFRPIIMLQRSLCNIIVIQVPKFPQFPSTGCWKTPFWVHSNVERSGSGARSQRAHGMWYVTSFFPGKTRDKNDKMVCVFFKTTKIVRCVTRPQINPVNLAGPPRHGYSRWCGCDADLRMNWSLMSGSGPQTTPKKVSFSQKGGSKNNFTQPSTMAFDLWRVKTQFTGVIFLKIQFHAKVWGFGVKTQNPSNCKKGGVEFPRSKFGDGFCSFPDMFGGFFFQCWCGWRTVHNFF